MGRLFPHRRIRLAPIDLVLVLVFAGLAAVLAHSTWSATRVDVVLAGVANDSALTLEEAGELLVSLTVDPSDRLDRARLMFNGVDVTDEAEVAGGTITWTAGTALEEGLYELRLAVPRPLFPAADFEWGFYVDASPPSLNFDGARPPGRSDDTDAGVLHAHVLPAVPVDAPVTVRGSVDPDSTLTLDGEKIDHHDGRFEVDFGRPPTGALRFDAVDPAGNHTVEELIVPVERPATRGVHVTAIAWRHAELRAGIEQLIAEGRISAVELDLKDEGGVVGYKSEVERAQEIGAVRPEYDLVDAVQYLHSKGVRVIGRIVAFRDPIFASAAWEEGRRDLVLQRPEGGMLDAYGGFSNYTHRDVWDYNLEIAAEAALAGVDEILWDYVRRPDGHPSTMVVPGLDGASHDAVARFLERGHELLREHGVLQGASLFGIAADRPDAIAQHVPTIARHTDYLAPMVYPSHWVRGEYGVAHPEAQPYDIVRASLADFQEKAKGTGTPLVPWLQDFTLGVPYGPAEVKAQIQAAEDLGIDSFLLWNARVRYTRDALAVS